MRPPLNWDILTSAQKSVVIGQLYDSLIYQSPILNLSDLGDALPASNYRRTGLMAYADGSDWNPGTMGAGEYVYEDSDWRKLQYAAHGELYASVVATVNNAASGTTVYGTILPLVAGESYHCTLDGATGKITFGAKGKFRVVVSLSISVDKNGKVHGDVFHNGAEVEKMAFTRTISTTGYGVIVITGILDVEKNDNVVVKLRHSAANSIMSVEHMNFNVARVA